MSLIVVGAKMTKKKLKHGAIPTLNMPVRSFSKQVTPRPPRKTLSTPTTINPYYKNLKDLNTRIKNLKSLNGWETFLTDNTTTFKRFTQPWSEPYLEVCIDDGLGFTIQAYKCFLPEDHTLYFI